MLKTALDGTGNSVGYLADSNGDFILDSDGNKQLLYLAPGTYYYQETVAPEGYQITDSGRHEIMLSADHSSVTVTNSADFGQILLTKVDRTDTDKTLAGAVFGVYTDPACTVPVEYNGAAVTLTTDENGQGTARVPAPSDGSATTYYLKEITAPDGYVLSQDVITVNVSKNQQTNAGKVENEPTRSIEITKTDSVTEAVLPGAVLELYGPYDTQLSEQEQAALTGSTTTATTDEDGVCTFSDLKPGSWYYIKERTAPAGYALSSEVLEVRTTDSGSEDMQVSKEFENDRLGRIEIEKTTNMDAPENGTLPFGGVAFTLYHAENQNGTWVTAGDPVTSGTTASNGTLSFDNLTPGDYLLVETIPDGYRTTTKGTPYLYVETDADGNDYGYIHVEVKPGMNQESSTGQEYDQAPTEVANITDKGKLELDKISSIRGGNGEVTHIVATFDIYKDTDGDGQPDVGDPVVEGFTTSGTSSYAVTGWLDPGEYVLVETSVAEGYTLNENPVPFKITAGQTTSLTGEDAVKNDPQGKVIFNKVARFQVSSAGSTGDDAWADYDLTGAVLWLFEKASNNPAEDIKADATPVDIIDMKNPSSSTGTSKLLDAGDYWVVEAEFPENYKAAEGTETVVINGETRYVVGSCTVEAGVTQPEETVIRNYTDKGKLRINKWDYLDQDRWLNGAEFEVYKVVDPGTEGAIPLPADPSIFVVLVQVSASTDDAGNIMQSGTHGNGSALSIDIEAGEYYIKETTTPEDDLYDENGRADDNWYPYGGAWSGPYTITEGGETVVNLYDYQMTGPGIKKDEEGNGLANAYLVAFQAEEDASDFQGYLRSQNIIQDITSRNTLIQNLTGAGDDNVAFRASHNIVEVTVSEANGAFSFNSLQPGETYYIIEAVPPAGYNLSDTVYEVTVDEDGEGFTGDGEYVQGGTLTVVDLALSHISVTKTTELNGTTYYVEGIKFNIYRAVEGGSYEGEGEKNYRKATYNDLGIAAPVGSQDTDTMPAVASGTTGADGIYTSILLETGYYIIEEEITDGSIVSYPEKQEDRYRVIFLETGQQVGNNKTAGSDATFENPASRGKFVLKKVDQEGNTISGVKFRLERQVTNEGSTGWSPVKEVVTSAANNGIYESDFLEPGTYRLVEIEANGYTIAYGEDNAVVFEIKAGKITGSSDTSIEPGAQPDIIENATLNQPILLANDEQGSLKVLKVGMYDGSVYDENLQGVQFGLYTDQSCSEDFLVSVKTTGTDGTCTWENLNAGTYYVKEIGTVTGSEADGKYTLSEEIRTVTIGVGEDVELVNATGDDLRFENNTTYGEFTIKKTDANDGGKALSGATFEIYTDAACTERAVAMDGKTLASITTGDDGTGTSPMLPGGVDYYLKEVTPPGGYVAEDGDAITGPYRVNANQITDYTDNPITNRKLFSIEVTKMVTGTSTPLAGARIGLYSDKTVAETGATEGDGVVAVLTTGANGKVSFDNLSFGDEDLTYYVREVSAPEGYDLKTDVYEVKVAYDAAKTVFTFEDNGGILYNDALGTVMIHKQGTWQGINDEAEVDVDLEGAVFALYKVDGCGDAPEQDAAPADTMTTGADGTVTSRGLAAGWYALVETGVPEGFSDDTEMYWVQIVNNTNTVTLYAADGTELSDHVIMNEPDQGRFVLYKYDGAEGKYGLTQLAGAVFRLEKEVGGKWVENNPANPTFTMTSHEGETYYTSGYLDPGSYRIIEVTAPTYSYTDGNGVVRTITFALLDEPIEFEITAGRTLRLSAYNSPKGTITLTKYGVDGDGETRAELAGATYALYSDEDCTQMISGSEKTTDVNGVITWTEMNPGTYWIKETTTGEDVVNNQGYAISPEVKSVTIDAGALIADVQAGELDQTVTFDDPSNAGKIRILKTNEDGTVKLSGATFEIYAKDGEGWSEEPVETLTITDANTGAVSGFLSADDEGTEYKIVETQAPNGYTLDDSLSELEQVVTVYPYHTPDAEAGEDSVNCFVFANVETDSITGLGGTIQKQIREAGDGDDETEFTDETVTASESLLVSGYTVEFKLDGYGDGNNEKPVRNLTVTDNDITLQWLEQVNDGSTEYRNLDTKDGDYIINSVTVKASANADTNERWALRFTCRILWKKKRPESGRN